MDFKEIERIVVDYFEANGAEVDLDTSGANEFFLDGMSLVDTDISLSALAIAIHTAVTRG